MRNELKALQRRGLGLALGSALLLAAPPAHAVNTQSHVASGNSQYLLSETAAVGSRGPLFIGIDYNVLNDPFVELSADRDQRVSTLVDSFMTWDLTVGYRFARRFSLNATLPLNLAHPVGEGRSFALGDARVFAKIPLLPLDWAWKLSLIPELRLPTGDASLFLSDDAVGPGLLLSAQRDFRYFSIVGNVGYRYSPDAVFRDLNYRQRIPLSLGLSVPMPFYARLSANGEIQGSRVLPFNGSQNPAEVYLGGRLQATDSVMLHAGACFTTFSTVPSANYRVLAGLKIELGSDPEPAMPKTELISATSAERAETAESGEISDTLRSSEAQRKAVLTPHKIELNQEVRFGHDSSRLTDGSELLLNHVAGLISANDAFIEKVTIEGHTNELGPDAYNLGLSKRRAASVKDYLVSREVPAAKLESVGYGESRPKKGSDQLPRAERLKADRRVEFKVTPAKEQETLGAPLGKR
jgi:outer membrane protein OmpA-like peptidoglycan-associated protein